MSATLRKNKLLIFLVVGYILLEIIGRVFNIHQLDMYAPRLIAYLLIASVLVVRPFVEKDGLAKNLVTLLVPIAALTFVTLTAVDPRLADYLVREDGLIEWLSALFLFVASLAMLWFAYRLYKKRNIVGAVVALLGCAALFIVGMEEISWMQRVFEIETPTELAQINSQKELNIHNIATRYFEQSYYFGGFLLLVALPFFQAPLQKLFKKTRLTRQLTVFLPAAWLMIPFSVISFFIISVALSDHSGFTNPTYTAIYTFTLFMLIAAFYRKDILTNQIALASIVIVLVTAALSVAILPFTNYGSARYHLIFEYREFFIAFGIAAYAIDRLHEFKKSGRKFFA